jgi:hypothetical protein
MTNTIVSPQYLVQLEKIALHLGIKWKLHLFQAGLVDRVIPPSRLFPSPIQLLRLAFYHGERWVKNGWRLHFCRPFRLDEAVEWYYLSRETVQVLESMEEDVVYWCLEAMGVYSSRSIRISRKFGERRFHQGSGFSLGNSFGEITMPGADC